MKVPEKEVPTMLKMEVIEDEYTNKSALNIFEADSSPFKYILFFEAASPEGQCLIY